MSIKMIFASTAALALVAGTPAFAAKGSQSEQASAAAGGQGAENKEARKICKTFDASETRMKRTRLCLTRSEWRKFEDEQR
jgi:hypothetical protein